ncbi:MAG: 2,3-bisphosphoglycerate-independent phosphoglycerate mutase, partial [Bacteroidia bacterium]
MNKKVVLVILDGWGIGDKSKADAIAHSKKPFFDSLMAKYPNATLLTCGENVG